MDFRRTHFHVVRLFLQRGGNSKSKTLENLGNFNQSISKGISFVRGRKTVTGRKTDLDI